MAAKWLDLFFAIAEAYKAGEISELECRDRMADLLDAMSER